MSTGPHDDPNATAELPVRVGTPPMPEAAPPAPEVTPPVPVPKRTHPTAWLWLSLLVVALDQATKFLAARFLDLYERVEVLPVLDFTLLHNTGAAFSLLATASGWQRGFFIGLALTVSLLLLVWIWRTPRGEKMLPLALSLVLGGALGNVIDRIAHGYVVDFVHVHWGASYFPAFNIADSAITIGAGLLILDAFRERR